MSGSLLFEAEPMVHPNVLEAYEQAIRVLRKARIPYRETGGIALSFYGAGPKSDKAFAAALGFAARLAPEVRAAYRRVWVKPEG